MHTKEDFEQSFVTTGDVGSASLVALLGVMGKAQCIQTSEAEVSRDSQ